MAVNETILIDFTDILNNNPSDAYVAVYVNSSNNVGNGRNLSKKYIKKSLLASLLLQTNGVNNTLQSVLNLIAGSNITLTPNGVGGVTIASSGGGSSILLQTDGIDNPTQNILNLVAGTNMTITDDGAGNITFDATGGGGGTYTVNNGLTESPANNFQLGGTLIQNTTINNPNFNFLITGSRAGFLPILNVVNTNNVGIKGESTNYIGVWGTSVNNVGVTGEGGLIGVYGAGNVNGAIGVQGYGINQIGIYATRGENVTNNLTRKVQSSDVNWIGAGNVANGFGLYYEHLASAQGMSSVLLGTDEYKWTNSVYANRTSQYEKYLVNNGITSIVMAQNGNGQLQLPKYGIGTFTGIVVKALGVDSSGNVIEFTAGGSSPLTTKGDLYTFDTADARLPVGLPTQVLLADPSTATGLKWGTNTTPPASGYYGAFSDVTDQFATVINTGYPMLLGVTDLTNGVTIVSGSRITIANTGIYNIQWSAQFRNPTAQIHDVTIWLRKNGVDVPGSSGIVAVTAKHGSFDGHVLPSWNFLLDPIAGDYYEFVWSTTDTSVFISFEPAGSPPPSTASVVLTVTQQAGILAGTGITGLGTVGNIQTGATQTLATGTSGTAFNISSSSNTQTFNIPLASTALVTAGLISKTDYDNFQSAYTNRITSLTTTGTGAATLVSNVLNIPTPVVPSAFITYRRLAVSSTLDATDLANVNLNAPYVVEMDVATANNLTIPLFATVAFPIGSQITVSQYGAGQTTIVATVGVTLRSTGSFLKLAAQYSMCTLMKVGTNEWYVVGQLAP